MIEKYINDKLLYKKGKNVFINQNNAVDFLKNKDNTYESKIKFLEHIRILEDYNAINILLKNFIEFPEDIRSYIITFLNGIPFTKIEENLKKLLNHREIPIRLSTLKALKNSSNPDLLEIIHPLIQHGNSEVKLSSLTAYFKIVSNIVSADISLLLSSEDAEVKQAAYESLKEITKSFTDIEEMKNITLIDSDLEKINNSSLKENFSAKGNISELVNSIEKIEKNSNYSFISILSIFALLSIIIVSNFYLYRKNDTENLLSFSPPKSVIFSPETTLSNEARVNGLEEFTRGNFDTAERYFQLINDTHIKNYYLFKINMKKENFKEAAVFFLNLPEYSADNLEEYISLIKKLIENKDFNTAISVAEKIAYFNSSELNRLILSLYENQDIEKALYFEKITGAGNIDILKKGADYFKNKDFDKSSYYYERIINLLRTYNEKEPYIIALYELHKKYDKIDLFRDKLNRYLILFPESRKLSELNNSQFK